MNSEQILEAIDKAQMEIPWNGKPTKFQNDIARVWYEGHFIARVNGFDWIDGEGYPKGFHDAVIKGMRHNLKVEPYSQEVHEFYNRFL